MPKLPSLPSAILPLVILCFVSSTASALSYTPIVEPVLTEHKTYYKAKRKLLSKLKKQGDLTGAEYFVLGIGCQVDDTPDSIILSMSAAAKCGANVPEYFIAAGIKGVPEGFYEASKKLEDPGLALGQGLLAVTFAPAGSELESSARDQLSQLKGAFEAAGGNDVYLEDTIKTIEGRIEQLIAAGSYASAPGKSILSQQQMAEVEVSKTYAESNEGPFGLTFGMSKAEVKLEQVASDKYGKDASNAYNRYYSCEKEMHYLLGGDYTFRRNVTMQDPNLVIRGQWIESLGQAGPDAARISKDFHSWHSGGLDGRTFQQRYWLTNDFAMSSKFADYTVETYQSGSGTRLCLAFFDDQLVRVKANLSAKRELIPGLKDKLDSDYAGSLKASLQHRKSGTESEVTTYRWTSAPKSVWVTLQHSDYKPPRNADYSRAYSFGATYSAPKPQHLQAYVDYTYMPLFSKMLDQYTSWVSNSQQQIREDRAEKKQEALDEF